MSRSRACALLLLLAAGCGDDKPAPNPPVAPASPAPATGTIGREEAEKRFEADRDAADQNARGLLKSFEAQVYDPDREGLIDALEGEVVLRADGREGRVSFAFDRAKAVSERLQLDASAIPAGFPSDVSEQVRRWVNLTCFGAYSFVAFHVPATRLVLAPSKDPGSLVIWAQPHRSPLNVSYALEKKRQVVTSRAEWTDAEHKFVVNYEWVNLRGRWFVQRSKTLQGPDMTSGPVAEFAFDEKDGPFLLRNVRVADGPRAYDAVFTYRSIRRRPPR
jgi:hypothetical protein